MHQFTKIPKSLQERKDVHLKYHCFMEVVFLSSVCLILLLLVFGDRMFCVVVVVVVVFVHLFFM